MKKNIFLRTILLMPILTSLPFVSTACNNGGGEVDTTIKIFDNQVVKKQAVTRNPAGNTRIKFLGFEYQNITDEMIDDGCLSVTTTIKTIEGLSIGSEIEDIDKEQKTFSVVLIFGQLVSDQPNLKGKFNFLLDDEEIEEQPQSDFEVSIYNSYGVTFSPSVEDHFCETDYNEEKQAKATFKNFYYENDELEPYIKEGKLNVTSTFKLSEEPPAVFTCSAVLTDEDENLFDVEVDISGGLPTHELRGELYFDIDSLPININAGIYGNIFTLQLNDVKSIAEPDNHTASCYIDEETDESNPTATIVYKNWILTGFDSPDGIVVSNDGFEATKPEGSTINYRIENWSEMSKCFDIVVTISNIRKFTTLTGQFSLKYQDKEIKHVVPPQDFTANINYSISRKYLNIDAQGLLGGLTEEGKTVLNNFNALNIPENVVSINPGSFKEQFVIGGVGQTIVNFSFANGTNIKTIRHNAFQGCTAFKQEDLIFPNSIEKIEDNAFDGCSGFTGLVDLPKNYASQSGYVEIGKQAFNNCSGLNGVKFNMTIDDVSGETMVVGESAFANCKNLNKLYFDDFIEGLAPTWLTKTPANIFAGVSTTGTVILSAASEEQIDAWKTGLASQGLSILTSIGWTIEYV